MFENEIWYKDLPSDSINCCVENVRLFFETMYERQLIWKRRFLDGKEKPWTTDKIFQDYKFTNVYRELDRSSQWQIKNIILDNSLNERNLIWKTIVYRYFNNPDTFELSKQLGFNWRNGIPNIEDYDEDEFLLFLQQVRKRIGNPFTNAYYINSTWSKGMGRDEAYARKALPLLRSNINRLIEIVHTANTPEEIIEFLCTLSGVANFIAHEFYQDFTYISRYTDREFMKFTQNDYINVGNGASLGIRLIFPNLKGIKRQKQGIYVLRDLAEEQLAEISRNSEPMPYLYWDKKRGEYYVNDECNITLHQIEMWLCEFSKYWKMMIGKGKQRSEFMEHNTKLIKL